MSGISSVDLDFGVLECRSRWVAGFFLVVWIVEAGGWMVFLEFC